MDALSEKFRAQVIRIWLQYRPVVVARLDPIDLAAAALEAGACSKAQLKTAEEAAHKLAGSLGTFGMPDGSETARELELLLREARPEPARVAALARELAAILARGPQ